MSETEKKGKKKNPKHAVLLYTSIYKRRGRGAFSAPPPQDTCSIHTHDHTFIQQGNTVKKITVAHVSYDCHSGKIGLF